MCDCDKGDKFNTMDRSPKKTSKKKSKPSMGGIYAAKPKK